MISRKARFLAAAVSLIGVALSLAVAGVAHAEGSDGATGYPSTQSPLQAVSAGGATLDNAITSFSDAANGDNRPDGANGTESEFPQADPRFVEGPVGGLVKNGPLE
jgi:hypothetical protein